MNPLLFVCVTNIFISLKIWSVPYVLHHEIEMDEKAGKYLKYKLVDELTDEEIALKLGVSRRALYGIKPNAYFRIAIWSHQVAYIKENTYEFIFNYAGLYERLK